MIPYLILPNYFKWIGLIFITGGFVLNGLNQPDINNLASGEGLLVQLLILCGLLLFTGSKQKTEDELVKHYRLVSLQWAVLIFITARASFKVIAWQQGDSTLETDFGVNFLLEVYVILFYYLIYVKDKLSQLFSANDKSE